MLLEMSMILLLVGFYFYMVAFTSDNRNIFAEMDVYLRKKNSAVLLKKHLITAIQLQIDASEYVIKIFQ